MLIADLIIVGASLYNPVVAQVIVVSIFMSNILSPWQKYKK